MYKSGEARPLLLPFPIFMMMDIYTVLMRRINQNRLPPNMELGLEKMRFESTITNNYLKAFMLLIFSFIAGMLCLLISPLPALCAPPPGGQTVGQISALIPSATRNAQPAKVKDDLSWNDLLKTEQKGRLRAGLTDGSILSLGSNSELRVVQHDAVSQQTSLEMNFGRVRSKVVKVTQPGGKFEVKTPNAVIGVIGTDFYVGYANNQTTVICYTGKVWVSPSGNAKVVKNSAEASAAEGNILVNAGQMVVIRDAPPVAGFQPGPTPLMAQQTSIDETDTQPPPGVAAHASAHILRNVLLGTGIVGAIVGVTVGVFETNKASRCNPKTGQCG